MDIPLDKKAILFDRLYDFITERHVKAFNEPEGNSDFIDGQLSILEELIEVIETS